MKVNDFLAEYLETKTDIRYLEIEKRLSTFDYYREVSSCLPADDVWHMLCYVAALYSAKQYAHKYDLRDRLILLLKEPEAHTFPYVVRLLTELIQEVSDYAYVIFTTHNGMHTSTIADEVGDVIVYYVYRDKHGWIRVIKISIEKLAKHIIELSDLLLMRLSEIVEKIAEQYSKPI